MITRNSLARLLTFALCFGINAAHALDLTPHRGWRKGNEGSPTPVLQFSDGQDRIDFPAPAGWEAGGGGRAVTFFTQDPMSWMKLVVADYASAASTGGVTMAKDDLQAWATQFVPSGAQRVEFVKMIPSPFTVENHPSTEFLFTCVLNGFRLSLSISVIDYSKKERLVMLIAAESGSFTQVRQEALASMFGWSREK